MNEQLTPTWEEIGREAHNLEITFDKSQGEVWMEKFESVCGWFQDSPAGRQAAMDWLQRTRRAMEERDRYRGREPFPQRRARRRWLWGRSVV